MKLRNESKHQTMNKCINQNIRSGLKIKKMHMLSLQFHVYLNHVSLVWQFLAFDNLFYIDACLNLISNKSWVVRKWISDKIALCKHYELHQLFLSFTQDINFNIEFVISRAIKHLENILFNKLRVNQHVSDIIRTLSWVRNEFRIQYESFYRFLTRRNCQLVSNNAYVRLQKWKKYNVLWNSQSSWSQNNHWHIGAFFTS